MIEYSYISTRICIARLNCDVKERDLEIFLKGYGKLLEIVIENGVGYVEFEDFRDADDAVFELNGKELLGNRVTVEFDLRNLNRRHQNNDTQRRCQSERGVEHKYSSPTMTERCLTVENLSNSVNWQNLKDYMAQAGEVTYAVAHTYKKNEGMVQFATFSGMINAIEKLDNTYLCGHRIKLVIDKSRHDCSYSRSRSNSHSRSRSNSNSKSKSRSKSPVEAEFNRCSYSRSRSKSPAEAGSSNSADWKQTQSCSASGGRI